MKKKKQQQGTHPWGKIIGNNPSVSQNLILDRKDKVKHYIRIKTHNTIALKFWCKTGVKYLISVRLMSYNHMELQSLDDHSHNSYINHIYEKI